MLNKNHLPKKSRKKNKKYYKLEKENGGVEKLSGNEINNMGR